MNRATIEGGEVTRYRDRVMGCWLGKAVGGTLGMPFEGVDGPLDLEFYEPVPTEMLPNDDLDLQVVWACTIAGLNEPRVDRHILANAWQTHVSFPWDEYGVALRNMANGLRPPLTGAHDNWFASGMGAAIRSELWACLAPGNAQLAAAYAYEDGCVDHAGEGIYSETFFAALGSMAFVESDTDRLLDGALSTLPEESLIRRAISDTRVWFHQTRDWRAVRELILRDYGHENFTDATMNVAFTILGWLAGEGDFSRAICIATNCGKDTDCTGATVGALMGILNPHGIPDRWLAPIGRDLVLSPGIVNLEAPSTLDSFTDLVLHLHERLNGRAPHAETFEQSADNLVIEAEYGFMSLQPAKEPAPQLEWGPVSFAGTVGQWADADFEDDYLLLRYAFRVDEERPAIVLFNTSQPCRVWLDGKFLFEREGGVMAPSFHRAPPNQSAPVFLSPGRHELIASIQRPGQGRTAEWVAGIGDGVTHQWLPEASLFRPSGELLFSRN